MIGTEDDVLWDEDHEESDESVDSDWLSGVPVTFYYNKTLTLINTFNIICHTNILTQVII
jgi:hypothetical protein